MNPSHPEFTVEIDVSHHYFYEPVSAGEASTEDEPIVQLIDGKIAKKKLKEFQTTTTICFSKDSIKTILDERDNVMEQQKEQVKNGIAVSQMEKQSFNMVVADHLRNAAMRDMAPSDKWVAIRVPSNPKLEAYLNVVFETNEAK